MQLSGECKNYTTTDIITLRYILQTEPHQNTQNRDKHVDIYIKKAV